MQAVDLVKGRERGPEGSQGGAQLPLPRWLPQPCAASASLHLVSRGEPTQQSSSLVARDQASHTYTRSSEGAEALPQAEGLGIEGAAAGKYQKPPILGPLEPGHEASLPHFSSLVQDGPSCSPSWPWSPPTALISLLALNNFSVPSQSLKQSHAPSGIQLTNNGKRVGKQG